MRRSRRHSSVLLVLFVVLAGACSEAGSDAAESGSGGEGTALHLRIVTPGVGSAVSNAGLAQALGYFEEEGLEVEMNAVGASTLLGTILTGAADVAAYTNAGQLVAGLQGKSTTALYAYQGNHSTGALTARKDITSIEQLQALDDCKMAATAPGASLFGYSTYYIDKLGLDCEITQFGDSGQALAAIITGNFDAGAMTYSDSFVPASEGKLNMLVDPTDEEDAEILGPGYTTNSWFAETGWVESHEEEVRRLLRAFDKANEALKTMSPEELGEALNSLDDPDWNASSAEEYTAQFEAVLPFINPNDGLITQDDWETGLEAFSLWGIEGYDPASPLFSYEERVGVSYYEDAIGTP